MRVGILCLMQESNTFLNRKTEFHHFEEDLLLEGNEIREKMVDSLDEVGGFLDGLDAAGFEAVPIFAARALPCLLYTSPSPRDGLLSRMPSSA